MKLNVPVDGLIDIDENGVAEVSSRCGKMLIEGTADWQEYKAGKTAKKSEDDGEQAGNAHVDGGDAGEPENDNTDGNEGETETDGEDAEGGEDKAQISDDKIIEGLKQLSLEDCIKTAQEAGYPKKEWEKLSKNEKAAERLMRNYLVKKFKDTIAVAE